jgi:aminopeptidase N
MDNKHNHRKINSGSLWMLFVLLLLQACGSKKNNYEVIIPTNARVERAYQVHEDYRASRPLDMRIKHTVLYLKPNFSEARMYGTAYITVVPHFYPSNNLDLDAKGFDIKRVEVVGDDYYNSLNYIYDGQVLKVRLDNTYPAGKQVTVLVEYVAKPNELKGTAGSSAIQGAKGLYFINPLGADSTKPMQLWTQGETESNSCWFPTIDAPNQKTTQEIYLTVDTAFQTLSNGDLIYSTDNGDGTRTDYWKQKLPHAPYLTMLAVGKFVVVKDKWRGKDVGYYVEPGFEPYAREIFANTPEMLEFFSKKLGVDYPWDKYSQVAVRDYVSGAMENTGAVVFGEWAQRTHREMLDGSAEGTVAHELFHHWFGDLVTCESWSNLSVNESFATYGSVLWNEHKYGQMAADAELYGNLQGYLREAKNKQVDLVRFYYDDKEDMFDSHSYAKGSRVLHMLRKEVGDAAFFAALKLFLTRHAYQAVEIHQLRLAFEEVTGRDMNWFFNQWFFAKGHPVITFNYGYDTEARQVVVEVIQDKSTPDAPLYRLPMMVDIYTRDSHTSHRIVVTREKQEFRFRSEKPVLVNADAEKVLLCEKRENKGTAEYVTQFRRAALFVDHYESLLFLRQQRNDPFAKAVFLDAFGHESSNLREYAIGQYNFDGWKQDSVLAARLWDIAKSDKNSGVRAAAIAKLGQISKGVNVSWFEHALQNDSSFRVMGAALRQIAVFDAKKAMELGLGLAEHRNMRTVIGELLAQHGDTSHASFFEDWFSASSPFVRMSMLTRYADLARRLDIDVFTRRVSAFMRQVEKYPYGNPVQRIAGQQAARVEELLLPMVDR